MNSSSGYLGSGIGSVGVATVDGPGSTWNFGWQGLNVGYYGSGTLNITHGGTVNGWAMIGSWAFAGAPWTSIGAITVDGSGSTLNSEQIYCGQGTLNVTHGGTVNSNTTYLGWAPGCPWAATVDGVGSTWTNSGPIYLGSNGGSGTLTITGGGTFSSAGGATIGDSSTNNCTSAVKIDGSGSTWTSGGAIIVGSYGNGTLMITNGGTLISAGGGSGGSSGAMGAITIDGINSTWTSSGGVGAAPTARSWSATAAASPAQGAVSAATAAARQA